MKGLHPFFRMAFALWALSQYLHLRWILWPQPNSGTRALQLEMLLKHLSPVSTGTPVLLQLGDPVILEWGMCSLLSDLSSFFQKTFTR